MLVIDNKRKRAMAFLVNLAMKAVFVPLSFFSFRNTKCAIRDVEPQKILLIRPDHIGDVIMTTPILPALRKKYPNSQISVLVGSWSKDVLLNNPYVDNIIVHDCYWWSKTRNPKSSLIKYLFDYLSLVKKLRKSGFDLTIEFQGDLRQILLFAYFSGAKHRLSFDRTGGEYLLTKVVPFQKSVHEVDKNIELIKSLGIEVKEPKLQIYPDKKDYLQVKKILHDNQLHKEDLKVIIHPGARVPVKRWPAEKFSELCDWMVNKYNAKILIVGGKDESSIAKAIADSIKASPVDLTGKTTLLQLKALFEMSSLFVGNESGVMHIAATTNIPVIVLFGPTDTLRTKPYCVSNIIIKKDFDCSPCCLEIPCDHDRRTSTSGACMEAIEVDEVKRCVEKILRR